MKTLFAALLLLFQFQPVIGTVACMGASRPTAARECRMPEHGQAPMSTRAIGSPGTASQHCELSAACTPATFGIPEPASAPITAVPPLQDAKPLAATHLFGLSQAPPFHPPRA
jgi:hypothetical protein